MRREERLFTAPDGRRIRGQLTGPEDGLPVIFHVGTPGSRYLWEGFVEAGAERGLRHICCSRPGYEGSDRQPGRSLADCAADTAAVADQLNLGKFYVVGGSTGASFALACAALLPDRVISAVAMAGFAPRSAEGLDWKAGMGQANIEEFRELEAGPAALEMFIKGEMAKLRKIKSKAQVVANLRGIVGEGDLEVSRGRFLDFQLDDCKRLSRGGIWGWYDDDLAIWGDWEFDPAQIDVPVSIWHGGEDELIPLSHGEWFVANVPGARSHLLPGASHMSLWASHYRSALDELLTI